MSGTHIVHDQFYGDEERFAVPRIIVETEDAERSSEAMTDQVETQLIAFRVKVRKPGHERLSSFEFHAASWGQAIEYAATKGVLVSIALAN
jgi:hypothetical protein